MGCLLDVLMWVSINLLSQIYENIVFSMNKTLVNLIKRIFYDPLLP